VHEYLASSCRGKGPSKLDRLVIEVVETNVVSLISCDFVCMALSLREDYGADQHSSTDVQTFDQS
jgi:hypothetical protein